MHVVKFVCAYAAAHGHHQHAMAAHGVMSSPSHAHTRRCAQQAAMAAGRALSLCAPVSVCVCLCLEYACVHVCV
jgi:hypothetical protein